MRLTFTPHTLYFKHAFSIAHGTRTSTPVVFTEIECDGIVGYGEASMPPYLGESHESALSFLSRSQAVLSKHTDPLQLSSILQEIDAIEKNNTAAKASIDIALHDLAGKLKNESWHSIWKLNKNNTPYTSYTIGMGTPEQIRQKIEEASPYKLIKVKLGSVNDKKIIETIRSATDKVLCVDVNQGWKDKYFALDMINWMSDKNIVFVEQPLPKEKLDDTAWLTERVSLPVIADESVQRLIDIDRLKGVYSGVNIKLMKCTGMNEAYKMIKRARELNMKVLIGCMSETSCAISAAAQLSPLVDWADLDGPLLIKEDFFEGVKFEGGKVILNDLPGIGVRKLQRKI